MSDHDVVQHPHIDECERCLETFRNPPIRLTGLGHPGGVVVVKDGCRRVEGQRLLHHNAGVDRRAIDRAMEEFLHGEHAMGVIQKDTAESFGGESRQS